MFTHAKMVIPADTSHLAFVRTVVSEAAALNAVFDEEHIYDLTLMVTEATTNAVKAHKEAAISAPVEIECRITDKQASLVIHDRGTGFDPDTIPKLPPIESPERLHHESGLGFALMEMLADKAEVRSGPDGTEVSLVLYAPTRKS